MRMFIYVVSGTCGGMICVITGGYGGVICVIRSWCVSYYQVVCVMSGVYQLCVVTGGYREE